MGSTINLGPKSVANFLNTFVGRMFGPQPVPVIDKRAQNLAQKKMNIRAVGVREGFTAMRARSEAMAQRVEEFKKHRHHEENANAIDPADQIETIVLSTTPARRADSTAS